MWSSVPSLTLLSLKTSWVCSGTKLEDTRPSSSKQNPGTLRSEVGRNLPGKCERDRSVALAMSRPTARGTRIKQHPPKTLRKNKNKDRSSEPSDTDLVR